MRTNTNRAILGWSLVVVITLLPVLRWLTIIDASKITSSRYFLFSFIAKFAALAGTMLYALNFILAVRAGWLERLFGSMNKVYIAHHVTGGIALILLCFHPLFISLRYLADLSATSLQVAADALLPDKMVFNEGLSSFFESAAINFGSIAFVGLVLLLFITFFVKLPYHLWLRIHRFLGVAFLFAGLHVVFVLSDVKNDAILRLYVVTWIGLGIAAFIHRSLLPNILVKEYIYKVASVVQSSANIVTITLTPQGAHIPFKAGQFVFIKFVGSKKVKEEMHPFSLVNAESSDSLQLQIKYLGDYTRSLAALEQGVTAKIEGAFGRFSPQLYKSTEQVWIAGGVGITPFLSAARTAKKDMKKTWLFHAVNERTELINDHEFNAYVGAMSGMFIYKPYVKNEQPDFLNIKYISTVLNGQLTDKTYFLCGPPAMMSAMRQQLKKAGVSNKHIISEEFALQ